MCAQVDDTALRCSPYLKQLGGASVPPPSADYIKGMGGTTETFRLSAGAWMGGWVGAWMNGWMGRCVDEWMDG